MAPLIRTSTPTSPGAVSALFGNPTSDEELDDTIEGFLDLGDRSNSKVILLNLPQETHEEASGDEDEGTLVSGDDAGADADNETEDDPNNLCPGHYHFIYGEAEPADGEAVPEPTDDTDKEEVEAPHNPLTQRHQRHCMHPQGNVGPTATSKLGLQRK